MNYLYDKYQVSDKWVAEDFERLADLCERLKKEDHKRIIIDTIPQDESEKGI